MSSITNHKDFFSSEKLHPVSESPLIQLIIQAYDKTALNRALEMIQSNYNISKLIQQKVIRLPTNRQTFTLLRSPHVHKKSREQFQRHQMKVCIYIQSQIFDTKTQPYSSCFWLNVVSSLGRLKLRGVQLSWKIQYYTSYDE